MVETGKVVPLGMLDGFQLERVDSIKLDVEGYESKVLESVNNDIERCHPIMYLENDHADKSAELLQRCFNMGYRLWWQTPPLFSPNNFRGNAENLFPNNLSINLRAICHDMSPIKGLNLILRVHDMWRSEAPGGTGPAGLQASPPGSDHFSCRVRYRLVNGNAQAQIH